MSGAINKWKAVVVVILKDEAKYIENWVCFHLSIGFEHFLVYDNGSLDGIANVLAKYIRGGVVTLISWPLRAGQIDAYNHALSLLREKSEWTCFLDVDEYLVLHHHETVCSYVSSLDTDQILIPWRNFPYSGHKVAPGGSDLESFFWAHKATPTSAVQVKHLVRTSTAVRATAHFSFISTNRTTIADGTPTPPTHIISSPTYGGAQINHYATRSLNENETRIKKGQVDGGAEKQLATFFPINAETASHFDYDATILRHLKAFAQVRERWASVSAEPHRYGMMQQKNVLPSWNNVPYFFCKSFLNYLAGASELSHGTSLEPIYVDTAGKEHRLSTFWANEGVESIHFRVDKRSFIPFFMGSVHYGDFVRRFGFEVRWVGREFNTDNTWSYLLDCRGRCPAAIFDIESTAGARITLDSGGEPIVDYSIPSGSHAGLIYMPNYFFEEIRIRYTVHGFSRFNELILGVFP
jgi:hypothetical protein